MDDTDDTDPTDRTDGPDQTDQTTEVVGSSDAHEVTQVDRLYELPPKEFVPARDDLARRLRATDRDAADRVRTLTRPTKAAWALNLVARESPDDVEALRDAGRAVRDAQEQAMSGSGEPDLRAADHRRDELVRRLLDAAVAHAGEGHRDAIEATLRAASVDADVGEQLAAGRLSKPTALGSGLGDLASMLEAGAPRRSRPTTDRPKADRVRRDLRRAEQTVDRVREEVARAQARVDRARADLDAAQARLDEHIARRDQLRGEIADAGD